MTAELTVRRPGDAAGQVASAGARDRRSLGVRSAAHRQALADSAPFAISLIPFGLAAGAASADAGLSFVEAMFGAVALLAGAAQLAAVESIGRGDGVLVVALLVALINLRFVVYGAGVAGWFAEAPQRRRLALVFPVVDQTFLLCQQRFGDEADLGWRQRYYLTVTATLATTFVSCQAISFLLGNGLPAGAGLHLGAPLAFAGLLARALDGRRAVVAAVVAGVLLVGVSGVAGPLGLPLAVGVGVAAAWPRGSTATSSEGAAR